MVSVRSGTISASAKSTERCLVCPAGRRLSLPTLGDSELPTPTLDDGVLPTLTLGSELTLCWRGVSLADAGELKPLDAGVSGVSGRYGDLTADITGLWSAEPRLSLTELDRYTHSSIHSLIN